MITNIYDILQVEDLFTVTGDEHTMYSFKNYVLPKFLKVDLNDFKLFR